MKPVYRRVLAVLLPHLRRRLEDHGMSAASASPLELDDAIVLLLGAPTGNTNLLGQLQGVTRLEKLVFLLERETGAKNWLNEKADFKPHNFGPFSAKVYQAVDMLSAAGIISDSRSRVDSTEESWEEQNLIGTGSDAQAADPYQTRDFALTDRGWRYYQVLTEQLDRDALSELSVFKDRFASLPLRQLVRYVYQRYDEYTGKSLIRDSILGSNG